MGLSVLFPLRHKMTKVPGPPCHIGYQTTKRLGSAGVISFFPCIYWKCLVIFAMLLEWFPPFWVRQDCSSRAQVTLAWRSVNFWRALFQQINPLKPPSTVYSVQYGYIISGLGWVQRPVQSKYHLILLQNKKCWRHVKLNHFFTPTAHCSKEIFVPW